MAGHGIALGVGDLGLTHVREFIEMMDRGGADICQPDISRGRRLHRHPARSPRPPQERGKRVITHGYKTNIEIAANLHFLAAQRDEEILEYSLSHSPLRWNTTREHFPVEQMVACACLRRLDWVSRSIRRAVAKYRWPQEHS